MYVIQKKIISQSMLSKDKSMDKKLYRNKNNKLWEMHDFALKLKTCRRKYLLEYFGKSTDLESRVFFFSNCLVDIFGLVMREFHFRNVTDANYQYLTSL